MIMKTILFILTLLPVHSFAMQESDKALEALITEPPPEEKFTEKHVWVIDINELSNENNTEDSHITPIRRPKKFRKSKNPDAQCLFNEICKAQNNGNVAEIIRLTHLINAMQNKQIVQIITTFSEKTAEQIKFILEDQSRQATRTAIGLGVISTLGSIAVALVSLYGPSS